MDLIKYKTGDGAKDGLHLPSVSLVQDCETLCGIFMDDCLPEEVDGLAPECPHCITIAKTILAKYPKKIVRTWGKK